MFFVYYFRIQVCSDFNEKVIDFIFEIHNSSVHSGKFTVIKKKKSPCILLINRMLVTTDSHLFFLLLYDIVVDDYVVTESRSVRRLTKRPEGVSLGYFIRVNNGIKCLLL